MNVTRVTDHDHYQHVTSSDPLQQVGNGSLPATLSDEHDPLRHQRECLEHETTLATHADRWANDYSRTYCRCGCRIGDHIWIERILSGTRFYGDCCGRPGLYRFSYRGRWDGQCFQCGRAIVHERIIRYCSPRCAQRHAQAERRALRPEPDTQPCDWCGELFTPARRDARYCGTRCRVAAHRERHRTGGDTDA